MFHDMLLYDNILAVAALIILFFAARYDMEGAEIPDDVTLPLFMIGMTASVMHGRWLTLIFSLSLLVVYLSGMKFPLLTKINCYLMERAYTDESLAKEENRLAAKAEVFENKNGKRVRSLCIFDLVLSIIVLGSAYYIHRETSNPIVLVAIIFYSFAFGIYMAFKPAAETGYDSCETEEISALGGADIIVFLSLLAFYGPVGFIYGMTATMGLALLVGLLRRVFHKECTGLPLLPVVLIAAPLRIYMAYSFVWMVERDLLWAFENILLT